MNTDSTRNHILQKYQVVPNAWLGKGMEADVYTVGTNEVLKLYAGTTSLARLTTLKNFYDSLDRHLVPYALPRIYTVAQEGDFLVTIERRLYGTPMSAVLPSLADSQLEQVMQRYFAAGLALSSIQASPSTGRYKLFDPDGISCRTKGDWHRFLDRYVMLRLEQAAPHLSREVSRLSVKVQHLRAILAQPYTGDYRLIHGDFFPGNLLINDDREITALLDFGLLTMYGDYLFDIATGWVFFDMYDDLKANARDRYLSMLLASLGEHVRAQLYRYVLIYSILSATTYSQDGMDGHYTWCVANLNHEDYWENIA